MRKKDAEKKIFYLNSNYFWQLHLVDRQHLVEMEVNIFKERKEYPLKHLFDGSELNVYENKYINLSAGICCN